MHSPRATFSTGAANMCMPLCVRSLLSAHPDQRAGLFATRQQLPYTTGPKLRKQPELKRLSFVRAYSVYLSAKLASMYSR